MSLSLTKLHRYSALNKRVMKRSFQTFLLAMTHCLSYLDSWYWLAGSVCRSVDLGLVLLQRNHRLLVGCDPLLLLLEIGTELRQSLGGRGGGGGGEGKRQSHSRSKEALEIQSSYSYL